MFINLRSILSAEPDTTPKKKKRKSRRVYPYGPAAARSADAFKELPFTFFATTLAAMYPFLANDKEQWDDIMKMHAYPMTHLWPVGPVRRSMHFIGKCLTHMGIVLESYEGQGGDYYGPEESSSDHYDDDISGDKVWEVVNDVDDVF